MAPRLRPFDPALLSGPLAILMGKSLEAMRAVKAMGAMMGSTAGAWMVLWILLGLAVAVTIGVVVARALGVGPKTGPAPIPPAESPAMREARDALRLRYANGEISREDYLQGRVELED